MSLAVGSPSIAACHTRRTLSTPPVTITFVLALKSNAFTPLFTDIVFAGLCRRQYSHVTETTILNPCSIGAAIIISAMVNVDYHRNKIAFRQHHSTYSYTNRLAHINYWLVIEGTGCVNNLPRVFNSCDVEQAVVEAATS